MKDVPLFHFRNKQRQSHNSGQSGAEDWRESVQSVATNFLHRMYLEDQSTARIAGFDLFEATSLQHGQAVWCRNRSYITNQALLANPSTVSICFLDLISKGHFHILFGILNWAWMANENMLYRATLCSASAFQKPACCVESGA